MDVAITAVGRVMILAALCLMSVRTAGAGDIDHLREAPEIAKWERESRAGDPVAMRNLGLAYRGGRGVAQDVDVAQSFMDMAERRRLQQLAVDWAKNPDFDMGMFFYSLGNNLGDNARAGLWFEKGAVKGDRNAQFYLGTMLFGGDGIDADPGQAARWLLAAARQGSSHAAAVYCDASRKAEIPGDAEAVVALCHD